MATNTPKLNLTKPDFTDVVDVSQLNSNADTIDAAVGSTIVTSTTRPASPFTGQVIFETDTEDSFVWDGSEWKPVGGGAIDELEDIGDVVITSPVDGQSLIYDGDNWVNRFLEFALEYVVIAGGGAGGGGSPPGAGGGAGGYRANVIGENSGGGTSSENVLTLSPGSYPVTVGAGGAGFVTNNTINTPGSSSVFHFVTSVGGGGGFGGNLNGAGGPGGSGGGAGGEGNSSGFVGGSGTANQGFNGGNNFGQSGGSTAGGGGGASQAGANAANNKGGNGGSGVISSITGSAVPRAGGGGGGTQVASGQTVGSGGSGGGGTGGLAFSAATNGGNNTGGGGGGGSGSGSNGGSGVVILKIAESATLTFSAGVTETNATSNGFTVYTVTAAGPTDTVTIV